MNLEDESAENHALVYIKKIKKTPAKFPRKSGTARTAVEKRGAVALTTNKTAPNAKETGWQ